MLLQCKTQALDNRLYEPHGVRDQGWITLSGCQPNRQQATWQHEDYDVFEGDRDVGRIFQQADGSWFWGVSFQITGRKSYGHATSLEEAKAAFRAEYEAWGECGG
jgi:hypothetical protein